MFLLCNQHSLIQMSHKQLFIFQLCDLFSLFMILFQPEQQFYQQPMNNSIDSIPIEDKKEESSIGLNENGQSSTEKELVNYNTVETKQQSSQKRQSSRKTLKSKNKIDEQQKREDTDEMGMLEKSQIISRNHSSKLLLKQKDKIAGRIQRNMLDESQDSVNELKIIYSNSQEQIGSQSKISVKEKRKPLKLEPLSSIMKNQNVKVLDGDDFGKKEQKQEKSPKKKQIKVFRASQIVDTHEFIKQAIPKNRRLIGVLKRDRNGLKRFFPQFDLYLTEELKYIMSSKRKACFCTSTYHMGSKIQAVSQLEQQYTGTVQSNFSGDQWNIYDNSFDSNNRILATICYQNQLTFSFTPRNIEVYIVSPYYTYGDLTGSHLNKNLQELYEITENKENRRIIKLTNKKPIYHEERGVWVMDFKGKAPMSSVKNMILVDALDERKQVMLLTKARDNAFNFQVNFPLSPRIAMAIANTSFDFKWVCQ